MCKAAMAVWTWCLDIRPYLEPIVSKYNTAALAILSEKWTRMSFQERFLIPLDTNGLV